MPNELKLHLLFFGKRLIEVIQCPCFIMNGDFFGAGQNESVIGLCKEQHVGDHAGQTLVLLCVGGKNVPVLV
ncbi:hypothetical protein D3C71_1800860 [compost metagenome]